MECRTCGSPTTLLIGGEPICEQCYENAGSCCPEFGGGDLWQGREEGSDESRSPPHGPDDHGTGAGGEERP